MKVHSGKSGTIRESNKVSVNVRRIMQSTMYETTPFLAGTGVRKISSVACGFNTIKIHFSDYPKSPISRINEVYVFFNKISL